MERIWIPGFIDKSVTLQLLPYLFFLTLTQSLPPSLPAFHSLGLPFPAKRSLLAWEGWAESRVGTCCDAACSYLSQVPLTKVPGHPLALMSMASSSPGSSPISQTSPQARIFTFFFLGPLLSKTTSSFQEPSSWHQIFLETKLSVPPV